MPIHKTKNNHVIQHLKIKHEYLYKHNGAIIMIYR